MHRALVAAVVAVLVTTVFAAAPASAHSVSGVSASNYETRLTDIAPRVPEGVTVRVVEAGSRLELTNRSDTEVVVAGYTDEPYLRVGPDGVFENVSSPATYINASRGGSEVPDGVDGKAAPRWRKVSSSPTVRWHDHRIHWMGTDDHPIARRDPDHRHLLGEWSVPMSVEGDPSSSFTVEGTLSWVPGPSPVPWFGVALFVAGVAGLLVFATRRQGWVVGAALLAVLLVVDVAHLVGTALAGADPFVTSVRKLAGGSVVSLAAWALLVAAIALLARRRAVGWSVALLGALIVFGTGGIADLTDLSRSQVPFEPSATAARALVAVTLGLAGVVAVRAGLRVVRPVSGSSSR